MNNEVLHNFRFILTHKRKSNTAKRDVSRSDVMVSHVKWLKIRHNL